MGKKVDAPKPPNYKPLIDASAAQAEKASAMAQEQFEWAKQAYAADKEISDRVTDTFLEAMDFNKANSEKDRARYESVFQPLEDDLVADAQSYASDERKATEIGRAKAGVAQTFEAARDNATRELESYGINPSATRFAALDIGVRTAEAASKAAAGDAASRYVDDTARALRADALNIGKGYPAQGLAYGAQSNQSGAGAQGAALNQTASGASSMGTAPGYMGAANSALGTWGGAMGAGYEAAMKKYEADKSNSSGLGNILGVAAGIGMNMIAPGSGSLVSPSVGMFEEGGVIPHTMSKSGGAIPDDVHIRATPGEYVIPDDVVRWKGEEFFHKLVDKTKQERSAIPVGPRDPNATTAIPSR